MVVATSHRLVGGVGDLMFDIQFSRFEFIHCFPTPSPDEWSHICSFSWMRP